MFPSAPKMTMQLFLCGKCLSDLFDQPHMSRNERPGIHVVYPKHPGSKKCKTKIQRADIRAHFWHCPLNYPGFECGSAK